ncbi:tyrosine-protein phosphatase [Sphingomonas immobilis]|uniref:Tyrosine-protein phosphatase n=1 Tax=Sphingomonas immobilis TaxID=3063997 RepID=A0ABT8ZZ73_9SPHN|nr:tyrosine-protein phosphatase [Sphingomonas sp. CA1-15]MDO7842285.1 tyrosine-protein phosphatase [Sphingomonas sp. CA1-15]
MSEAIVLDRLVECRRIFNFRDYGGYATPHGRLRERRLFRSAQHFDATPEDLATVAGLGLGAVIDLRGKSERIAAPCPRPDGFDAEVILIEDETVTQAPHVEAARGAMDADQARESMMNTYRTMPFRPVLMELYTRYFARLADLDRPTLIHCLAGKDRTGIAVALLHHLVGVHPDDMMADYLLTNITGNIEARVAAGGLHIKAIFGDMTDDGLRALMSVEPRYLQNGFAAMVERYGSIDGYLRDGLGVTPEQREKIIARLVE